jgi:ribosomal protein RSM22 (predicted rRNA methylase)
MKLSQIYPFLNYHFTSESDLVRAIQEISQNFTQNRQDIKEYLNDPRLSSAYTAFYLTTNIPKLQGVFQWMDESWLEKLKKCILYDVGAGPGTFSFAFRQWLGHPLKITQIENSPIMRDQAKKIWDGLYPGEFLNQSFQRQENIEEEKLMLFGHSANEMGALQVLRYIEEVRPEHILFIEPGTKDFFSTMLDIREKLLAKGYEILFPCTDSTSCPLSNQNKDWCHQFLYVKQDSEVERLSQMAKKDRRLLPLTVQAFSLSTKRVTSSARVIRVFSETKFSFEWEVCEKNLIYHFQVMKRGLSKQNLDLFAFVKAGDMILAEVDKTLEKQVRVKIKALNNLTIEP